MRYLIYMRVSTEDQQTDMQLTECQTLCNRRGATKILVFTDDIMESGKPLKDRVQLQAMLDCLHEGDTVVVYDIDRMTRDLLEGVTLYREIKYLGASITSVKDENCDNEFIWNIKACVAQEVKKKIRQTTKDSLKEKKRKGECVGTVPYGYRLDMTKLQTMRENKKSTGKPYLLIEDENEQIVISRMLDLRLGGLSYQEIADTIESDGLFNRRGRPFHKTNVHKIVSSRMHQKAG